MARACVKALRRAPCASSVGDSLRHAYVVVCVGVVRRAALRLLIGRYVLVTIPYWEWQDHANKGQAACAAYLAVCCHMSPTMPCLAASVHALTRHGCIDADGCMDAARTLTRDVCPPTGEAGFVPRASEWHESFASFPALPTEYAITNRHTGQV